MSTCNCYEIVFLELWSPLLGILPLCDTIYSSQTGKLQKSTQDKDKSITQLALKCITISCIQYHICMVHEHKEIPQHLYPLFGGWHGQKKLSRKTTWLCFCYSTVCLNAVCMPFVLYVCVGPISHTRLHVIYLMFITTSVHMNTLGYG